MNDFKAEPDSLVVLFPVTWEPDNIESLTQLHREHWQEEATYTLTDESVDDDSIEAAGVIELPGVEDDPAVEASLVVEDSIEELLDLVPRSKEPFTPAEAMLIKKHSAIWRVVLPDGGELGAAAGRSIARIMSTFVETGAAGAFLPNTVELHSPSFVKSQTINLDRMQSLTHIFLGAWDQDDWMVTRGLTAFGLPELETPIDQGLNAAYFRLMDIATGMLGQQSPYPAGASLRVGPTSFVIEEGPEGPKDEQVPMSGTFGVQTVRPT